MKRYSVTLYDLIGYLVPGLMFNISLVLFLCLVHESDNPILIFFGLKWPWHLLFGYTSGHIVQAITTILFPSKFLDWWKSNNWDNSFKKSIIERFNRVYQINNCKADNPGALFVHLADKVADINFSSEKTDTFRTLQSFFRAMTGILILLGVIFSAYFLTNHLLTIHVGNSSYVVSKYYFGTMSLLSWCSSILFYKRFRKFAAYRWRTIVIESYIGMSISDDQIIDQGITE